MGMFDDITCEATLPDGVEVPHTFQTKDLECLLDSYRITADGELWLLDFRMEFDPDHPNDIWPYRRTDEEWKRVEDYHGDLCFYDSISGAWHEYVARFTDGKLDSIRVVPDRYPVSG